MSHLSSIRQRHRVEPVAPRLQCHIAVFVMVTAMASTELVRAHASSSSPDVARSTTPEPQSATTSVWDAPEPWRTDRFYFETSVYTRHYRDDAAHNDHQDAIVVEWNVTEQWLVGAGAFNNSYGQASQYVYGGYRFRPFENLQPLYFKLTGGLVHGYRGQYQHKIPFNGSGVAPTIVPSVGYCFDRFCSELVFIGGAGAMLSVGVTVP